MKWLGNEPEYFAQTDCILHLKSVHQTHWVQILFINQLSYLCNNDWHRLQRNITITLIFFKNLQNYHPCIFLSESSIFLQKFEIVWILSRSISRFEGMKATLMVILIYFVINYFHNVRKLENSNSNSSLIFS